MSSGLSIFIKLPVGPEVNDWLRQTIIFFRGKRGKVKTILGENKLAPFTFRQMAVSSIEFQALHGPEARPLGAKTIRQGSFLGPGGQAVLCARAG
jgi:hypothetical protein